MNSVFISCPKGYEVSTQFSKKALREKDFEEDVNLIKAEDREEAKKKQFSWITDPKDKWQGCHRRKNQRPKT